MTNKKIPVGIIGGGISGLSIAYGLERKGIEAVVYEQSETVGGAISSVVKEDWLVEEGPNTLMVRSQSIWDLLEELGLKDQVMEANPAARKRYVVRERTPRALPNSLGSFLKTPLFSAGAKLQLLKEPFIASTNRHDESIASFVTRRMGRQPLEYAVNPFVSGIFAGDPEKLSMKHTFSSLWEMEQQQGSLLKGMIKKDRPDNAPKRALISFKKGNQVLPTALATALSEPVQISTEITAADWQNGQWQLTGRSQGENFSAGHDCLVSAVPVHNTGTVFSGKQFQDLAALPYAPLKVIAMGFREDQVGHPLDGFGMLIPEIEDYKTLGVLFSSTLFPGRAPKGHHLLTCFIGGARNPGWTRKPEDEIVEQVLQELEDLLDVRGEPSFMHRRLWSGTIPQYEVGYDYYLSLIKEIEAANPGLYLDGNFRGGVSVPDCIASGFETAHKVHTWLRSKSGS